MCACESECVSVGVCVGVDGCAYEREKERRNLVVGVLWLMVIRQWVQFMEQAACYFLNNILYFPVLLHPFS